MNTKRIITNEKVWLEGKAVDQFNHTAGLENMQHAVAFPDLHPGRGIPIGAAFISKEKIYPHLIGNDIGCGIGLWQTDLKIHKIKLDKFYKKMNKFAQAEYPQNKIDQLLEINQLPKDFYTSALGTIGSGNHFAELLKFETINDEMLFSQLNLNHQQMLIMVHCGSRNLGSTILHDYTKKYEGKGINSNENDAQNYLQRHNQACDWAKINRHIIAEKIMQILHCSGNFVSDTMHNMLSPLTNNLWLHRKGAADALDNNAVVIAGSRGDFSYLVKANNPSYDSAFSLAHGAGRKWQRSEVKQRLSHKYKVKELQKTKLGSRVICSDRQLLYEEAPQAYKNISDVIEALVEADLITVIAKLRPLLTYKKGDC